MVDTVIPSSSVVPSNERHTSSREIDLFFFDMIVFAFLAGVIVADDCGGAFFLGVAAFFLGVADFFLGEASSSSS